MRLAQANEVFTSYRVFRIFCNGRAGVFPWTTPDNILSISNTTGHSRWGLFRFKFFAQENVEFLKLAFYMMVHRMMQVALEKQSWIRLANLQLWSLFLTGVVINTLWPLKSLSSPVALEMCEAISGTFILLKIWRMKLLKIWKKWKYLWFEKRFSAISCGNRSFCRLFGTATDCV